MLGGHGTRFISAGEGRAIAELDFRPELAPLTGMFHVGVIVSFAEETASSAAMWEFNPTAELRPDLIPLTFQLSVNLIRNTNRGTLRAEAEIIHRGRTTVLVESKVRDDQGRLIAAMVVTMLAPGALRR